MRGRKSGFVVFLGSMAGWSGAPGLGMHTASKHAIRAFASSLAREVAPLGIKVLNIEPGYFRTALLQPGMRSEYKARIPAYQPVVGPMNDMLQATNGKQAGDPVKGADVLVDIVHGEGAAKGKELPVTNGLGSDYYDTVKAFAGGTLKRLADWEQLTKSTDFP